MGLATSSRARVGVAALLVASVVAAAIVGGGDDGDVPVAAVTSTVVASTTTTAPVPPTIEAPPPPSTVVTTTPAPPPPEAAKVVVSPAGVVLPVLGRDAGGYKVSTPCGKTAMLRTATPVAGAAVVLDAGHGGVEPGAVGPNGLTEKVLNLAVAQHAKAALEQAGFAVVMTRTGDYRMTLESRAKVVTVLAPKAFVSIHHNAEPDGPRAAGPGSETYYQLASADSKRLSGLIYEEIVKALATYSGVAWVADTDAGAKYRTNDKGEDYYGIIRRTQGVPSSLAELAFISNPPEADLLARPDVQQVEGQAVARGIVRYLTTRDPGTGYSTPYPRTSPAGSGGGSSNCVDPTL